MDRRAAAGKVCFPWERLQDGRGSLDFCISGERWTWSFTMRQASAISYRSCYLKAFVLRAAQINLLKSSGSHWAAVFAVVYLTPVRTFHHVTNCDHIQARHVHAPLLFALSYFISCSITGKHELVFTKLRYAPLSWLTAENFYSLVSREFSLNQILFKTPVPFFFY